MNCISEDKSETEHSHDGISNATNTTEDTSFQCYDGSVISEDLKCNMAPDCTKSVITQLTIDNEYYKFEDEFGCDHSIGIECNYSSSATSGEEAWVPPRYLCDGHRICQSNEDEKNCAKAFTCTKDAEK